jgi:GntR family transcriptional repressor for pyruvate dehydrogenase complex
MQYSQWSSVPEYIIVQLKKMITSGEYKSGDRFLTEKEICEKYNVGRSSVREALRVMQTLGYIELQRSRGAFVTKTAEEDKQQLKNWYSEHEIELQDIIDVRLCIETVAIKNAIHRITPTQLERLRKVVENMKKAAEEDLSHELIPLDEEFHSIIIEASFNKLLIMLNKQVQKVTSEYRGRTYTFRSFALRNAIIHEKILNHIIAKDVDAAVSEMKDHINSMKDNLLDITNN